jgi:hypothetical protein
MQLTRDQSYTNPYSRQRTVRLALGLIPTADTSHAFADYGLNPPIGGYGVYRMVSWSMRLGPLSLMVWRNNEGRHGWYWVWAHRWSWSLPGGLQRMKQYR